jgi:hypothetical protein
MKNKTECTGFLARTTIKPETKAKLDKTESIMVRRPSLKWNLNAGARRRIQVDLLQPARLFVFHFLLPSRRSSYKRKHSLNYLLNLVFLSTPRILDVSGSIRGSACFSPTLAYEMDNPCSHSSWIFRASVIISLDCPLSINMQ